MKDTFKSIFDRESWSKEPIHVARRRLVATVGVLAATAALLIPAVARGDNVLWDRVAICSTPISPDDSGEISPRNIATASASIGYPLATNEGDYAGNTFSDTVVKLAGAATEISQSDGKPYICINANRGALGRNPSSGAITITGSPYVYDGLPDGKIIFETKYRTDVDILG